MAWNTHRLQAVIDLAPIRHEHINMRGILTFDFAQHASGLLRQALIVSNDRTSK